MMRVEDLKLWKLRQEPSDVVIHTSPQAKLLGSHLLQSTLHCTTNPHHGGAHLTEICMWERRGQSVYLYEVH